MNVSDSTPKREPAAYAIPRFSVTRPVTVLMGLLAILVVGYIAYTRIPLSLFPEGMEGNMLFVNVQYPNATPRDIEEKISRKVEDILGTVPNVKLIRSFSNNGNAGVQIEFQSGTNMRNAYALVSDRMERVRPQLPEDVDRIWVNRWNQSEGPMMNLMASLPPEMEDAAFRLENYVKPAIQRIEGVGNVDIWGIQAREVQVMLKDELLRSHRIDVSAMVNNLRNQNFSLSGGYVFEGGRKIYVRSMGKFNSVEEIGELIIDREERLRLRDVAEVSFRLPQRDWVFRVDGQPAVGIQVTRESTGNIDQISRDVQATLGNLQRMPQLAGVRFETFFDQGAQVRKSINALEEAGLWGGIFAALVIYIFLRAPRLTGILTMSIPLSLLCTLIVLYFMGWSLNMATMMGLLIAVGMVVDNAIVIVENIYRHRQAGVEAKAASIQGAGELGLAVMMSTCTSIVVFLPLILMKQAGDFSFWMLRIGVPVIISLLASLLIALVLVPLAAQRLSRGTRHNDLRVIAWLRERYLRALNWVLGHRLDATLIAVMALLTLPYAQRNLVRPANPYMGLGGGGPQQNMMRFFFEMPSGATIDSTDGFFAKFEGFLQANAKRYNVERIETRFSYNRGQIQMKLHDDPNTAWYAFAWDSFARWMKWRTPPMDPMEIETDVRAKFTFPPGVTVRSLQRGAAPQDAGMSIALYGEDTETLLVVAEEAVRRLRTIPGLLSVDTDLERGGQELRIELDRERARELGINPQAVSSNIRDSMRGLEVGRYYGPDGRELRIFAQLGEADRARMDDVRNLTFQTENGVEVPLETLADLTVARTLGQIQRESRQTVLRITARAPRQDARQLFDAVDRAMAGFEMPRNYRWDKGGGFNILAENEKARKFALGLAVVFVFLLMGLLFESFVLPLAVMVAVPFSFLGVYWMLYATGTAFDIMASIGSVILVGVVVNNAIVFIDMTNRLRAGGLTRLEALLQSGRHRFRPILMTTLTTVCALIPMAVSNSRINNLSYAPLGRTMMGGLLAASALTLLMVPLFYTLLDDLREHVGKLFSTAWSRRNEPTDGAATGAAAGVGRAGPVE